MVATMNNEAVDNLRREYHYSESHYLATFSDARAPMIINQDFLTCMRHSHQVITAKQTWEEQTIIEILRTHLRNALSDNHLEGETIRKMAYSLYYYAPLNELSWYSLMTFFFYLGNGYIVSSKVSTSGQLIGALKIFLNDAKRREDECQRIILAEEKAKSKEEDNCISWEALCQRRGYPEEWYDLCNYHMYLLQQEGKSVNLTLINNRK